MNQLSVHGFSPVLRLSGHTGYFRFVGPWHNCDTLVLEWTVIFVDEAGILNHKEPTNVDVSQIRERDPPTRKVYLTTSYDLRIWLLSQRCSLSKMVVFDSCCWEPLSRVQ